MNITDYEKVLADATESDWKHIPCWGAGAGPSFLNEFSISTTNTGEFSGIEIESHSDVASLKTNLLVTVAWGLPYRESFKEDWATGFADAHASSGYLDFFYSGALIYRDVYVLVDGGRCYLPLPRRISDQQNHAIERITVPESKASFYRTLNELMTSIDYDHYLTRAGIEVVDGPWMT